jgi:UDP-glucuronate decarboxylase
VIRWISPEIGTAAFENIDPSTDAFVLDVRDLVDKAGNPVPAVRRKLDDALAALRDGRRVVVCCDYGMSRSNAVAAGVVAAEEGIPYDDAVRRVVEATGETAIQIEVLAAVRAAVESARPSRAERTRRSIVVTGGSGFIGRQLVERLEQSCEVAAPSRDELDLTCNVVALDRLVRERDADTIVHLANPRVYTTNTAVGEMVTLLKNVLDVCVGQRAHLVFPSSWEVFSGYRTRHLLADESVTPYPGSNYGHAKLLCEQLIEQVQARTQLPHTLLRIGPVYGAAGTRPKFIWNFIAKALGSAPIVTHRYRNGEPTLDLMHVDDAVDALVAVVRLRPEETLHLGTGTSTSTLEVAGTIVSLTGSSSRVDSQEIDDDAANIAMDASRARALLGWEPKRLLVDGLRELVEAGTLAAAATG